VGELARILIGSFVDVALAIYRGKSPSLEYIVKVYLLASKWFWVGVVLAYGFVDSFFLGKPKSEPIKEDGFRFWCNICQSWNGSAGLLSDRPWRHRHFHARYCWSGNNGDHWISCAHGLPPLIHRKGIERKNPDGTIDYPWGR
jgi:hypothetical protein